MPPTTLLSLPLEIIDEIIQHVVYSPTETPLRSYQENDELIKKILQNPLEHRPTKESKDLVIAISNPASVHNCRTLLLMSRFMNERTKVLTARNPKGYELHALIKDKTVFAKWTSLPDWTSLTKDYISFTIHCWPPISPHIIEQSLVRRHLSTNPLGYGYEAELLFTELCIFWALWDHLKKNYGAMLTTRQLILHSVSEAPSLALLRHTSRVGIGIGAVLVQFVYSIWVQHWSVPRSADDIPALNRITIRFWNGAEWEWCHAGEQYPDNLVTCTYRSADSCDCKKESVYIARA